MKAGKRRRSSWALGWVHNFSRSSKLITSKHLFLHLQEYRLKTQPSWLENKRDHRKEALNSVCSVTEQGKCELPKVPFQASDMLLLNNKRSPNKNYSETIQESWYSFYCKLKFQLDLMILYRKMYNFKMRSWSENHQRWPPKAFLYVRFLRGKLSFLQD